MGSERYTQSEPSVMEKFGENIKTFFKHLGQAFLGLVGMSRKDK